MNNHLRGLKLVKILLLSMAFVPSVWSSYTSQVCEPGTGCINLAPDDPNGTLVTECKGQLSSKSEWVSGSVKVIETVSGALLSASEYTVATSGQNLSVCFDKRTCGRYAVSATCKFTYTLTVPPEGTPKCTKPNDTTKDSTATFEVVKFELAPLEKVICACDLCQPKSFTATVCPTGAELFWSIKPIDEDGARIDSSTGKINPGTKAGTYTVTAQLENDSTCKKEATLIVYKVESVAWENYPGNDLLDACPNNGGLRIFPDKMNPADANASLRKNVLVKAKISPALANQMVFFRFFDVDDPSTAAPPVDPNDESGPTGADNFGSGSNLSATYMVKTDSDGFATFTFKASLQPGDNFRAFCACSEEQIGWLSQASVDADHIPPNVVFSPMLTVWRRLWLEFDSMGPVASTGPEMNFEIGTIGSVEQNAPAAGKSTLDVGKKLQDEENRYNSGVVVINGIKYPVESNTDNWFLDDDVVVAGVVPVAAAGMAYAIYDDDYDPATLQPNRLLPYAISGGGLLDSSFGEAYIKPTPAPHDYIDNNSTFYRNLNDGVVNDDDAKGKILEMKDLSGTADFWVVHLLASWQGDIAEDYDSDFALTDEDPPRTTGFSFDADNTGAIFVEVLREAEWSPKNPRRNEYSTVVHEIGHMGGGKHEDLGIMAEGAPPDEKRFKPITLHRFRSEVEF